MLYLLYATFQPLVYVLICVVIFLIIIYVAKFIMAELAVPANIVKIVYLILFLIGLVWMLHYFGVY
jgi:hypothetical protein